MKQHFIAAISLLAMLFQVGCAEERPKYTSADALREAAGPLLIPVPPSKDQWASFANADWEFVVDYLGSSDSEMRDAAAELLIKNMSNSIPHKIRSSKFTEYLAENFPPKVRIVALAYSFLGVRAGKPANRSQGTKAWSEPHQQTEERFSSMKEAWGSTLNSLVKEGAISGDAGYAIVSAMSGAGGPKEVVKLLSEENRLTFSDSLPYLFNGPSARPATVMSALDALSLDLAIPSLVKWYKQEQDRSARLAALTHSGLLNGLAPNHQARQDQLMPFLQLAARDADPEIAAKAKDLMR